MRVLAILILASIVLGFIWVRFMRRRRKIAAKKARRDLYHQLDQEAAGGSKKAMYQLAKLFYEEEDSRYYPLIFKWVQTLSEQTTDPSVWMMRGDLFFYGCGTDKNHPQALSSYEKALSNEIALGKQTPLSSQAHNYLEKQVIRLREEIHPAN